MRFLHTSDWQLGMRRYFLDGEAQARFTGERFDAVVRLGELARAERCDFIVAAGDLFESNQVDRRTVLRALDALRSVEVPLFLLPGNHDSYDAASVYRSPELAGGLPENVHVLTDRRPIEVAPGVEVAGAPWPTRQPRGDLVAESASELPPLPGGLRVLVAHGRIDEGARDPGEPALIRLEAAERAIAEGRFHYLALGDRHSATRVTDRIWYSGTPEPTAFDEERPGRVLLVDLEPGICRVEERRIGAWRFLAEERRLGGEEDVAELEAWLEALPDKPRTVLRLTLVGQLPLHARVRLDDILERARERFGGVDHWQAASDLVLVPDDLDRDRLGLGGWAGAAVDRLLEEARGEGGTGAGAADPDEIAAARDALALAYRLAGGAEPA
jgi:DNA repair exonuclease SbcCD nuclease subunit